MTPDQQIAIATRKYVWEKKYHEVVGDGIAKLIELAFDSSKTNAEKSVSASILDRAIRHAARQMEFILPRLRDVTVTDDRANKPISEWTNAELVAALRGAGTSASARSDAEPSGIH